MVHDLPDATNWQRCVPNLTKSGRHQSLWGFFSDQVQLPPSLSIRSFESVNYCFLLLTL